MPIILIFLDHNLMLRQMLQKQLGPPHDICTTLEKLNQYVTWCMML